MEKKIRKQDRREYTIKIIPHQGETVRSIRMPMNTIKYSVAAVCAGALLFFGALGYSTYNVAQLQQDQSELNELRQANTLQQEQILQLSKKANSLQEDMNALSDLEKEIRQLAAMESTPAAKSAAEHQGQGGPGVQPDVEILNAVLDHLSQSAKERKKTFEELKSALVTRKAQLSVTPSIWPASGDVSSRYGLRWNGSDFHPGIDIANDSGTPITATADGVVVSSGWNSGGYGYMVDIDHGNGVVTRYAHSSQVVVQSGEMVKKGQVIAYMGSTGFSTGPHVHYEVIISGKAVDPSRFL